LRKIFPTVAAFILLGALVVQAQPPDAKGTGKGIGKGGGYAPKNLQVLDNNTFPNSMQAFVQALGVADQGRCNYCHVEGDKASDEKKQKKRHLLDLPPRQRNTGNGALGW
jgi:hypothetical protein